MKLTIYIAIFISLIVGMIYYLTAYKSAFEADQQCHYEMSIGLIEEATLGCDHDLETRQWLLYKNSEDSIPAIVLKRFRY